MSDYVIAFLLRTASCLAALLIAGCAADTVTSVLPIAGKVLEPDRVVVHDFDVTPGAAEFSGGEQDIQTTEEIRVGKILAGALSKRLVGELRNYGIKASLSTEAAPPEDNTISIKGRFMRIEGGSRSNPVGGFHFADQVRTRIMIFQGARLYLQFIAQADTATQASLKAGMAPEAETTAVEADAQRSAKDVAARIADYYRKRGWLKP
jgi:hypothetical protein